MTLIYAVYKRPTSDIATHTDRKWGGHKKVFHASGNQRKASVSILMEDKIKFKAKDC